MGRRRRRLNRRATAALSGDRPFTADVTSMSKFGDSRFNRMVEALSPKERPPRRPKPVTIRRFSWEKEEE